MGTFYDFLTQACRIPTKTEAGPACATFTQISHKDLTGGFELTIFSNREA